MTLKEMKEKTYKLIEEISDDEEKLTDDPDYEKKVNTCINMIQNELARIKKIPAKLTYDIEENGNIYTMPSEMYQIYKIPNIRYQIFGNEIHFETEEKEATIYYYKYPTQITEDTDDEEYNFELAQDVLEIMPFGIAGDMLKSDPSTDYGAVYSNRYNELKQYLDTRNTNGIIFINTEGAID